MSSHRLTIRFFATHPPHASIHHFSGTEAISTPFEFAAHIQTNSHHTIKSIVLGTSATITIQHINSKSYRYFNGIINTIEHYKTIQSHHYYRITLIPWLSLLDNHYANRIFCKQSTEEIINQIFQEQGYTDIIWQSKGGCTKQHSICIQHNESTFTFISRLLLEAGMSYCFVHTKEKHTLVLFQNQYSCNTHPTPLTISTGSSSRCNLYHWKRKITSNSAYEKNADSSTNHNYKTSMNTITNTRHQKDDKPSPYITSNTALCHLLSITPGMECSLSNTDRPSLIITSINHQMTLSNINKQKISLCDYRSKVKWYTERAEVKHTKFTKQYINTSLQVATVASNRFQDDTSKEREQTKKQLTIKIRFNWKQHSSGPTLSCPLQIKPIACSNHMNEWVPQEGQDVIICFINGNINNPIAISCLVNKNKQSLTQAYHKPNISQFIFTSQQQDRTHIHCGKLIFDNTFNNEQLTIESAGHWLETIKRNNTTTIKGDYKEKIITGNKLVETMNKNITLQAPCIKLQCGTSALTIDKNGINIKSKTIQLQSQGATHSGLSRKGDYHQCPKVTENNLPHIGGPILEGSSNVLINSMPAARLNDKAFCNFETDYLSQGINGIIINNKPAVSKQLMTQHQGIVNEGSLDVMSLPLSIIKKQPHKPTWDGNSTG